ncbi:hypothetical protein LRP52_37375 [Photobacterium sp. ZSDE20]|uniref:Uncharacterized protein n=1 Tax=Photobacterium pectinilyticum TaxID=2906793 RepID=A0ABT1N0V6_9GAMM|nr:hypothetical protein [Photobacterium sp. ZSDE20]MCQ1058363.1 hypothetical protein [Photobacterium sp. ZSDE20]MDD1827860.1 hypothetical protein [Photobacterium sp. ZSDE20]
MEDITQQRGDANIQFALILIGIAVSVYIGGLLAFLYIKFIHGKFHQDSIEESILKNVIAVSVVTGVMYAASWIGVHLANNQYPYDIYPLAQAFFVECLLAMTWSSIVHYKWKESTPKRLVALWVGLAAIFICWESFLEALIFGVNFRWLLELGFYQHVFFQTINTSVDAFHGAIDIITNPKQYAIDLFYDCYGIQFLMVKDFPKWSVVLLGGLVLMSPKYIFQHVAGEEKNQ